MSNKVKARVAVVSAADRLVIVRLTLSQWYPRKYDRKASLQLAEMHGASMGEEIVRVNKCLVNIATIKPLQHEFSMLRKRHYDMTSPWNDKGERLLPIELYLKYTEMVGDFTQRIDELADDFCHNKYGEQVAQAHRRLGTLMDEADFPSAEEVRRRFGVAYSFSTLPDPASARSLSAAEDVRLQIEQQAEADLERGLIEAQRSLLERLIERATEFVDKVHRFNDGRSNALYTSALENLRDVVDIVREGLRITDDDDLTKMADRLHGVIDGLVIEQLRDSDTTREQRASEVKKIVDEFGSLYGGWER